MKTNNKDDYLILKFTVSVLSVITALTAFIYSMTLLSKIPSQSKEPIKHQIKNDSINYKLKNKK